MFRDFFAQRPGARRQSSDRRTINQRPCLPEAERLDPSRYDDDGQNVGDENVGVELDGVRHAAGLGVRALTVDVRARHIPAGVRNCSIPRPLPHLLYIRARRLLRDISDTKVHPDRR